jgi:integrase/recombinase XerD
MYTHRNMNIVERRAAAPVEVQPLSYALIDQFESYIDAKPRTVNAYVSNIKRFAWYLNQEGIHSPTRQDILDYRSYLKEHYKPATVQSYMVAVRLFFQWTEQAGLYPNVAQRIKGATISKEHKKDHLTSGQMQRVLDTVDRSTPEGKRDYAILALMVTGGLRGIEIHRANIEDLRTLGDSTVLYIQGKGKEEKADYIKIMPVVEAALRDYIKTRGELIEGEALFTSMSNNSKGQRLSTRSISGIVKQRLKDAGFNSDRLTAHSLRHTAVTLSLIGGNTLQEVQQFARHGNISTTQIYAHNLDRAKNKCEETISGSIFTQ